MQVLGPGEQILDRHQPQGGRGVLHRHQVLELALGALGQDAAAALVG
jgi:hypothetical protein